MPWFIKTEYTDENGKPVNKTERITMHATAETVLAEAFSKVIIETMADATDDESDITVTVAYVGSRARTL